MEFVCSFNFDLGEKAVAALLIPASLFLKIPFNSITRVLLIFKCPQLYQSIIILLKNLNIGSNGKFDNSSRSLPKGSVLIKVFGATYRVTHVIAFF